MENRRSYIILEDKDGNEVLPVTDWKGVFVEGGETSLDVKIAKIDKQLDTKINKYNTLDELKNDSKIKENVLCETLGYKNVNDGGKALYKIVNVKDGYCETLSNGLFAKLIHNNVFKPEQFGCVGQLDCSENFNKMIKFIETIVPLHDFNNESSTNCYDWSSIKLEFNREYLISSSIVFNNTIYLNIDNLKLKAINSFVRDMPLLKLNGNNRNFNITNSNFDCNYICDIGVMLTDYTIGSSISNCYIYGFLTKGYYAINTGYEVKFNNVKIEQCTWENVSKLNELTDGIGIHLGARQQDYKFNNVIINYCKNNGMYLESGANFLNNVHLWGCNFKSLGRYNFFTNCYFDTTLETNGYFSFNNCFFAFSKSEPIIKSLENNGDEWNFAYGKITNCTFTSSLNISSFFENVPTNYYPLMLNNSFQNVKLVVNKSVGEVFGDGYYPVKQTRYNGTSDVNIINFGELVFMYGSGTGSKTFNFPVALGTVLGYSATNKSGGSTINANATNSYLYVGSDSEYTWHIIGTIKI